MKSIYDNNQEIPNNWHIVKLGDDLQETIIKTYPNVYTAIAVLNRLASIHKMKFKPDDSILGGYYVSQDRFCYYIK